VKYAKSAVVVCGAALALCGTAAPAGASPSASDPTSPDLSLDALAAKAVSGLTGQPLTEVLKQSMPVNGPTVRALTRPVDTALHDTVQNALAGKSLVPVGLGPLGDS
jgi:hypothetical protein